MLCEEIGLLFPIVRAGYWREYPTSRDIEFHKFYKCPFGEKACPDGSETGSGGGDNVSANVSTNNRRCNIGYNDNGPLCATCEAGYVLMKGTCEPCDGMGAKAAARINLLMYFGVVMMVLIFWLFVTQPALTKKSAKRIRELLDGKEKPDLEKDKGDLERLFDTMKEYQQKENKKYKENKKIEEGLVGRRAFGSALQKECPESRLTVNQNEQLFDQIDQGGGGSIG